MFEFVFEIDNLMCLTWHMSSKNVYFYKWVLIGLTCIKTVEILSVSSENCFQVCTFRSPLFSSMVDDNVQAGKFV